MATRDRIDKLLVQRGFFASRSRAKRALMAGMVRVDGQLVDKAGTRVDVEAQIDVIEDPNPYVSRGGLKLAQALDIFEIDVNGCTALDIGASTGGFTDCLLKSGAAEVWAVDVGYGQLDWSLRSDDRVVVLERTNARYLEPSDFPHPFDLVVIDVSFISLTKIIPPAVDLLDRNGKIVALVKPQFEAGPERVGKGGVVRERTVHFEILKDLMEFIEENRCRTAGLTYSPVTGAKGGNIEFLLYAIRESPGKGMFDEQRIERINSVLDAAYREHQE